MDATRSLQVVLILSAIGMLSLCSNAKAMSNEDLYAAANYYNEAGIDNYHIAMLNRQWLANKDTRKAYVLFRRMFKQAYKTWRDEKPRGKYVPHTDGRVQLKKQYDTEHSVKLNWDNLSYEFKF